MPEPLSPYREAVSRTLLRNVAIAMVAGIVIALRLGGLKLWPLTTAVALFFTLGGHLVEVWYLNTLSPRLSQSRLTLTSARFATWFIGGSLLGLAAFRVGSLVRPMWRIWSVPWWTGGLILICAELIAHTALAARGKPNAFNGRG